MPASTPDPNSPYRTPRTYSGRRSRNRQLPTARPESPTPSPRRSSRIRQLPTSQLESPTPSRRRTKASRVTDDQDLEDDAFVLERNSAKTEIHQCSEQTPNASADAEIQLQALRDAEEKRNNCVICYNLNWQPCILQCGHVFCGECLIQSRSTDIESGRLPACKMCRAIISRKPVFCYDLRDRVEAMARDQGFLIPQPRPFVWPIPYIPQNPLILPRLSLSPQAIRNATTAARRRTAPTGRPGL